MGFKCSHFFRNALKILYTCNLIIPFFQMPNYSYLSLLKF